MNAHGHRYWVGLNQPGAPDASFSSKLYAAESFAKMLYFSTATMTGGGFGDIFPVVWYVYLLTCTQMLLGVIYSVAILGRGFSIMNEASWGKQRKSPKVLRQSVGPPASQGTTESIVGALSL
jgi:hypothetical protein